MSEKDLVELDGRKISKEEFSKIEEIYKTTSFKQLKKIRENVYRTIMRLED